MNSVIEDVTERDGGVIALKIKRTVEIENEDRPAMIVYYIASIPYYLDVYFICKRSTIAMTDDTIVFKTVFLSTSVLSQSALGQKNL